MSNNDLTAPATFEETTFDEQSILDWAQSNDGGGLPGFSAAAFARWLDGAWNDFGDGSGAPTNEDVLKGALAAWKGEA